MKFKKTDHLVMKENKNKVKFKKEELLELLDEGNTDHLVMKENKIDNHNRWTVGYVLVFQKDDKFYKTNYRVGATEYQDESPWEYDGDEVECIEVEPYEKTITAYKVKE